MNQMKSVIDACWSELMAIGFDELVVGVGRERVFGVRVANSVICRENVMTSQRKLSIKAALGRCRAQRVLAMQTPEGLLAAARLLYRELKDRSPDAEYVPAERLEAGRSWRMKSAGFERSYGPDALYPVLEANLRRVRAQGLRATGYFEVRESEWLERHHSGVELESFDHGMTMTVTIDDRRGATGVAKGALSQVEDGELSAVVAALVDDAVAVAVRNRDTEVLEPGDYTVILSPHAVYQMLSVSLWYGMYSRRKVDEGRTWLAGHRQELCFPEGLVFAQEVSRRLGAHTLGGVDLNARRAPCRDLALIAGGRIAGLHTDAFWASKSGEAETFSPTDAPVTVLESRDDSIPMYPGLQEMIAGSERAIFINDFWYLRMVAEMEGVVTGMTRDGVFEVRDGQIVRALKNMRWHENPIAVLQRVVGITESLKLFGRSRLADGSLMAVMPALKLERFHFSSVTRF